MKRGPARFIAQIKSKQTGTLRQQTRGIWHFSNPV
jgi:hypothetical protein